MYICKKIDAMRSILVIFLSFVVFLGYASPPANLSGWSIVFEDDFEGSSLDKSKWNPTYNWGHTHNHQAYCVEENVSVSNGLLHIKGEAKRHPQAPQTCTNGGNTYSLDYTSGAIDTRGKFEIQYGYIEGRFKMPKQLGTWPAFWMLQDGWPPEIDIFEVPHERTVNHYYFHYTNTDWYASHGSAWDHEASFGGTHSGPDKSADFHNYGLEWNSEYMNFYFDDKLVASYNRPTEISQAKAMYIIVNLAIGGWAISGDRPIQVTANNPAYLECDWIRVWKKNPAIDLPSGKVRFYSLDEHQCMQADEYDIKLGDCSSASSLATITETGSAYRISFGDRVLEIPNESKNKDAAVGLWEWNGKAHQQVALQREKEYSDFVVSMNFVHSGYSILTEKGDVIQSTPQNNSLSSLWRICTEGEDPTSLQKVDSQSDLTFYYSKGYLYFNSTNRQKGMFTILDMRGVCRKVDTLSYEGIDISSFVSTGIYILIVTTEKETKSYRLVVD